MGKGEQYVPTRFYNETVDGDACVNWMITGHPGRKKQFIFFKSDLTWINYNFLAPERFGIPLE